MSYFRMTYATAPREMVLVIPGKNAQIEGAPNLGLAHRAMEFVALVILAVCVQFDTIINSQVLAVTLGCGATTRENCTYLVQESTMTRPQVSCSYTICKSADNICRIRFDLNVS